MTDFENFREDRMALTWRLEEIEGKERLFWLSFCDKEKPKGQQFLGVVITKQLGVIHAICHTHALGINPGGQVLSYEFGKEPPCFEQVKDRLLSKEDLIQFGLIQEGEA